MEEMCRWIVSFPVATRNFLRQNPGELAELEGDSEEFWLVGWLVGKQTVISHEGLRGVLKMEGVR